MSAIQSTNSNEINRRQSPAGLFAHHGIWGPGIKLMRRVHFGTKALLICIAFMVPVVTLTGLYLHLQSELIAFTEREVQGVGALELVAPLSSDIGAVRNAARVGWSGKDTGADYSSARLRADAALSKLDQWLDSTGDALALRGVAQELRRAWGQALQEANGGAATDKLIFREVNANNTRLNELLGTQSNLLLDPDADTYFLISTELLDFTEFRENAGQVWAWSLYGLKKGSLTRQQEASLAGWRALAQRAHRHLKDDLQRAVDANASLKVIDMSRVDEAEQAAEQAYKAWVDSEHGDASRVDKLYAQGKAAFEQLNAFSDAGVHELSRLLHDRIADARVKRNTTLAMTVTLVLLALYAFYCFYLTTRGGMKLVGRHIDEVSQGDLRNRPGEPWGRDEPAQLIRELRKLYDSMHELIGRVRHSAVELNSTAGEIASASSDLSSRTEAAAAALEEQAATMDELGSAVATTAEKTHSASLFSAENAEVSERGGTVIRNVVSTMHDISSSSDRIGSIVTVIDEIAFQTNLLALNAAVEAARAGSAGRGFAVVATEVRGLAKRSADAAREIKVLIQESVGRAEAGKAVVEDAGQTMVSVVANARQVDVFLRDIATATREQATGVEQVVHAIQSLEHDAQQNAALVEETYAAAASMRQQADGLMQEIGKFQVRKALA